MSVVNHDYRYIFCHEPHTGGRAIEKALLLQQSSHSFNGDHHISVIDMIDKEWVTEEQFDTYWKFRVIRNPYDWLVTCWLRNTKNYHHGQGSLKHQEFFTTWVFGKGLGFMINDTLFWRYQEVDSNLRFEKLQENLNYMFMSQDLPTVRLDVVGATEEKPDWRTMLTVAHAKRLEEFYPDINAYGYNLFR